MTRRGLFSFIGAAAATATLDPERLLWQPGAKLISIPAPTVRVVTLWPVPVEPGSYPIGHIFTEIITRVEFERRYPRGSAANIIKAAMDTMPEPTPETMDRAIYDINTMLDRWTREELSDGEFYRRTYV